MNLEQIETQRAESLLPSTSKSVNAQIPSRPDSQVQAPSSKVSSQVSDSQDISPEILAPELNQTQIPVSEQKRGAPYLEQITGLVPTPDDKFWGGLDSSLIKRVCFGMCTLISNTLSFI